MNYDDYINKLIEKDEFAFEKVYSASYKTVFLVIKSIVKSDDVTLDLVQDTYIQAISSIHSYKRNGKFLAWICSIAHRKAIDYYRREKRIVNIDVTDSDTYLESHTPEYEKHLVLEELLSKLDPVEYQVVMLYNIEGYTHKEIAEILKKPLGTITWTYNKAIKKLRKEANNETWRS